MSTAAFPTEVPFHVLHQRSIAHQRGNDWAVDCACGQVCIGIGTYGAATRAHAEHQTRSAQLSPVQRAALTAAAADPAGLVPPVATRTARVLVERGLIAADGDEYRITGAGLGTLAEARRRNP